MQMCSGPTPMHCSTGQCKIASPLFFAALQTRLTAALCHCKYTYADLLFRQVCGDSTPMHCSTGLDKISSPTVMCCSAKKAHSRHNVTASRPIERFVPRTGVRWPNTNALQHWSRQNSFPTVRCCSANQADSSLVSLKIHLGRFGLHAGVRWPNTNALQHWSRQNSFPTVQCCSANQAHSRHSVTANRPMEICSAYRCAVMQHQCTAAIVRAE